MRRASQILARTRGPLMLLADFSDATYPTVRLRTSLGKTSTTRSRLRAMNGQRGAKAGRYRAPSPYSYDTNG